MLCLTSSTERRLPYSCMKSSWKLHFATARSFLKVFFSFYLARRPHVCIRTCNFSGAETDQGHEKYPLSKSDGGQWMELSEGSEWWNKTFTQLSQALCPYPPVCFLLYLLLVTSWLLKIFPPLFLPLSLPHLELWTGNSMNGFLWRPSYYALIAALAQLVAGEWWCYSTDRMINHPVSPNDNFISHLHIHEEILPECFSPLQLLIDL